MIIEPFKVNGFSLTDMQDLSEELSNEATSALALGLHIFPPEFQCEALRRDPNGEYPIIRMGVFNRPGNKLFGAVWFGCNTLAPGHTDKDARIFTRPLAGPILQHEALFWKGPVLRKIIEHLLNNQLTTREGGTVQIVGFDYITDPAARPVGLAKIHTDLDAEFMDDKNDRKETPLSKGRFEVRITKKAVGNGRP